jgi:hypothetical protein
LNQDPEFDIKITKVTPEFVSEQQKIYKKFFNKFNSTRKLTEAERVLSWISNEFESVQATRDVPELFSARNPGWIVSCWRCRFQ